MIKGYRSKHRRIQEELNQYDTCSSPELHGNEHENSNSSKIISLIEKLPPDYSNYDKKKYNEFKFYYFTINNSATKHYYQ